MIKLGGMLPVNAFEMALTHQKGRLITPQELSFKQGMVFQRRPCPKARRPQGKKKERQSEGHHTCNVISC